MGPGRGMASPSSPLLRPLLLLLLCLAHGSLAPARAQQVPYTPTTCGVTEPGQPYSFRLYETHFPGVTDPASCVALCRTFQYWAVIPEDSDLDAGCYCKLSGLDFFEAPSRSIALGLVPRCTFFLSAAAAAPLLSAAGAPLSAAAGAPLCPFRMYSAANANFGFRPDDDSVVAWSLVETAAECSEFCLPRPFGYYYQLASSVNRSPGGWAPGNCTCHTRCSSTRFECQSPMTFVHGYLCKVPADTPSTVGAAGASVLPLGSAGAGGGFSISGQDAGEGGPGGEWQPAYRMGTKGGRPGLVSMATRGDRGGRVPGLVTSSLGPEEQLCVASALPQSSLTCNKQGAPRGVPSAGGSVGQGYKCQLCNPSSVLPIVDAQLFCDFDTFQPLTYAGVSQSCVLPGVIAPRQCYSFSFVNPVEFDWPIMVLEGDYFQKTVVSVVPRSSGAPSEVSLSCAPDGYETVTWRSAGTLYKFACRVVNGAPSPVWNVRLGCSNFRPASLSGLNPDCTLSRVLGPGQSASFSFSTPPRSPGVALSVEGYSTMADL